MSQSRLKMSNGKDYKMANKNDEVVISITRELREKLKWIAKANRRTMRAQLGVMLDEAKSKVPFEDRTDISVDTNENGDW